MHALRFFLMRTHIVLTFLVLNSLATTQCQAQTVVYTPTSGQTFHVGDPIDMTTGNIPGATKWVILTLIFTEYDPCTGEVYNTYEVWQTGPSYRISFDENTGVSTGAGATGTATRPDLDLGQPNSYYVISMQFYHYGTNGLPESLGTKSQIIHIEN